MEPCNHTSVGVLIQDPSARILLINRARPPYGWAPPAGHVDPGENFRTAASREVFEEVGLAVGPDSLIQLWRGQQDNRCHRPGGDHHRWIVYGATTDAIPHGSAVETRGLMWATNEDLAYLTAITERHLAAGAPPMDWFIDPGLEPVWMDMMQRIVPDPEVATP